MSQDGGWRIGVDTGGTFTDLVAVSPRGEVRLRKVSSTPERPSSAVFEALGIPLGGDGPGFFWADELFISSVDSPASSGKPTGRGHLAFQATDEDAVRRFHDLAVEAGGTSNGAPGQRPYHPGYYAAFVLDPDGNNIEVVYHGPAKRSASSGA